MLDKTAILKSAQKFVAKGQIDNAIELLEKLLNEHQDGNIYNSIGDLYLKKNIKNNAVDSFIKAANIFREDGFYLKAIALYKKILNISPLAKEALIALAELNAEKGLPGIANDYFFTAAEQYMREEASAEALEHYNNMLNLFPSNIGLKMKMAELCLTNGLQEDAVKIYLSVALDFLEKKDFEKSQEFYNKAIELAPDNVDAIVGLSRIAEGKNDIEEAYKNLNKAVSMAPDNVNFLFNYARLSIQTNNIDNAKQSLTKLLDIEPSNNQYKKLLGDIYLKEGSIENAWEQLLPYIDDILHSDGYNEAVELLNNFREKEPVAVMQRLITLYKEKNDTQSLMSELRGLAETFEGKDLLENSLQTYKELCSLDPSDATVTDKITALEKTLETTAEPSVKTPQDKQPETAATQETTTDTAKTSQESLEESIAEAEFYAQQGMTDEAVKLYEKLLPVAPDNKDIRQKLEALKPATTSGTSDRTSTDESLKESMTEADFYAQQGLTDEAIELYEKLLSIAPDKKEIRQKLEALKSVKTPDKNVPGEKIEAKLSSSEAQSSEQAGSEHEVMGVFDKFKKKIDEKLGEKDFESHYNLGIAYKEMGLIDDAIREFFIASKDPQRTVQTASMLASCYMDKKLYPLAIKELKKVFGKISPQDDGYLESKIHLAEAHEKNQEYADALKIYKEVQAKDSGFKGIKGKIDKVTSLISDDDKNKPKSKKDRVSYL
jgi:tetratricopeptide (TPR) repeat protein